MQAPRRHLSTRVMERSPLGSSADATRTASLVFGPSPVTRYLVQGQIDTAWSWVLNFPGPLCRSCLPAACGTGFEGRAARCACRLRAGCPRSSRSSRCTSSRKALGPGLAQPFDHGNSRCRYERQRLRACRWPASSSSAAVELRWCGPVRRGSRSRRGPLRRYLGKGTREPHRSGATRARIRAQPLFTRNSLPRMMR